MSQQKLLAHLGEGISFYGVCKTNVLGGVVLQYII
jgi:hypothetical protein